MAFEKYKPRDLFSEFYGIHTQWSWWFKTSDWFAISDYDVIFTALGGEYLASPQTSFGVRLSCVHFSFFLGEKWMRDERTPKDVCGEARNVAVVDDLWFALGVKASWSKITNGKKIYRVLPSSQNLEATGAVGANLPPFSGLRWIRRTASLQSPTLVNLYTERQPFTVQPMKRPQISPWTKASCFFLLKSFHFVGGDRFFFHTNPYISNVMQQCRCSRCLYFELGLPVVPLWRVWLWFSSILVWDRV